MSLHHQCSYWSNPISVEVGVGGHWLTTGLDWEMGHRSLVAANERIVFIFDSSRAAHFIYVRNSYWGGQKLQVKSPVYPKLKKTTKKLFFKMCKTCSFFKGWEQLANCCLWPNFYDLSFKQRSFILRIWLFFGLALIPVFGLYILQTFKILMCSFILYSCAVDLAYYTTLQSGEMSTIRGRSITI